MKRSVSDPEAPVIVVGCGKAKHDHPMPIADLYTGMYKRHSVAWARSLSGVRLFVFSAAYGIVAGDVVVEPYRASFAKPGPYNADPRPPTHPLVSRSRIRQQVIEYDIHGWIILLAGEDYADRLRAAAGDLVQPFNPIADLAVERGGDRRIGYQSAILKEFTGSIPT